MATRDLLGTLVLLMLTGVPADSDAQVQPQLAERYFKEAATL